MKFTIATSLIATATCASAFVGPHTVTSVHSSLLRQHSKLNAVSEETLKGAQGMIDTIIDDTNANPFFVRLAWHDSGTYDAKLADQEWPKAGGAIGSIRYDPEITHGANKGLSNAVKMLEPVKEAFPEMSYADIFQMASARGIEKAGGPKIEMK